MRYLIALLIGFVIIATLSPITSANELEDFLAYRDQFYSLDKQHFDRITCKIESDLLSNSVNQFKAQMVPLKDSLEIVENMVDFSLVYSASSGLHINEPSFEIIIKSEERVADIAKLKQGIEMVKTGFKYQVVGVKTQLEGLFEGFVSYKKEDYEIKEFGKTDDILTMKYKKKGDSVTETFTNNQREVQMIGKDDEEVHSIENYEEIDNNKLVLRNAKVTFKNKTSKIYTDLSITYKNIGSVLFPNTITSKTVLELQFTRQEGQSKLTLKECMIY